MFSANFPEVDDGAGEGEGFCFEEFVFEAEGSAGEVGVVVDDGYDFDDHIFFFALAQQVLFGHALEDVLVAPDLQLPLLAHVEHVLEHLEVPVALVQDLEALESHQVAVQRVAEGQVVHFRQVGHCSLVERLQGKGPLSAGLGFFHLQVLRRN